PKAAATGSRKRKVEPDSRQSNTAGSPPGAKSACRQERVAWMSPPSSPVIPQRSSSPKEIPAKAAPMSTRWAMLLEGGGVTLPAKRDGPTNTSCTPSHLQFKGPENGADDLGLGSRGIHP